MNVDYVIVCTHRNLDKGMRKGISNASHCLPFQLHLEKWSCCELNTVATAFHGTFPELLLVELTVKCRLRFWSDTQKKAPPTSPSSFWMNHADSCKSA